MPGECLATCEQHWRDAGVVEVQNLLDEIDAVFGRQISFVRLQQRVHFRAECARQLLGSLMHLLCGLSRLRFFFFLGDSCRLFFRLRDK